MKHLNYIDKSNEHYITKYGAGFDIRIPFLGKGGKYKYMIVDTSRIDHNNAYIYFKNASTIKKENLSLDWTKLEDSRFIWFLFNMNIETLYLMYDDDNIITTIELNNRR